MHTGQSVALIPGGISEMMNCHPHSATINVSKKHYGFVRLAIQQGYHLVPTFFFHANDQYDNPMKDFQLLTYKYFRIPVGLPWYTNRWRFPISNRNPVRFALGKVIKVTQCSNPSEEMIKKGMLLVITCSKHAMDSFVIHRLQKILLHCHQHLDG